MNALAAFTLISALLLGLIRIYRSAFSSFRRRLKSEQCRQSLLMRRIASMSCTAVSRR